MILVEIIVMAAIAWVAAELVAKRRHNKFLQKAPYFWGTDPGSVCFTGDGIRLVDQKTGHETWIRPGGISFTGPGESLSMRSEPPTLHPQNSGIGRLEIGIDNDERSGLKIFGPRTSDEYLADYEQTVEIAVMKDGSIQTRGLNQGDKGTIVRY